MLLNGNPTKYRHDGYRMWLGPYGYVNSRVCCNEPCQTIIVYDIVNATINAPTYFYLRKPCYRNVDGAMHAPYRFPGNFPESLTTPTLHTLLHFKRVFVRMGRFCSGQKFEECSLLFICAWDISYVKSLGTGSLRYAVQGHPTSLILVPIESACVTSY